MTRKIVGGLMVLAAAILFFLAASSAAPPIDAKDPLTVYFVLYDLFQRIAVIIGASAIFVGGCVVAASHRPMT
jgi:hypothetical protein